MSTTTRERHVIQMAWKKWLLVLPALAVLIPLALLVAGHGARRAGGQPASPLTYHGCAVTPQRLDTFEPGSYIEDFPWAQASPASSDITAHLIYARNTATYYPLYTSGRAPTGGATSIVWMVRNPAGDAELVVRGTEIFPAAGSFQQSFAQSAWQVGNYPSVVEVPSPGCWRLTASTGTLSATLTF